MTPLEVWIATAATALVSGFVPVVNIEAYLLAAAALAPGAPALLVVAAAAVGQMAAKTVLFFGGRGLVSLPSRRVERARDLAGRLAARGRSAPALVFTSALTGLPPFYVVSVAAGMGGFRAGSFLLAGLAGRSLRFGAVFAAPTFLLWVLS
jgi:membrane protein YqaA with SNARE-associated domain